MYKKLIHPLQMWLLTQGRCVGCGSPIAQGVSKETKGKEVVKCPKCTRLFVKESDGKFRRALQEEV